jgi:asparagine synthase (glutamine-hydrolysing)
MALRNTAYCVRGSFTWYAAAMCGIAGLVQLRGERESPPPAISAMTGAVAHRGPDDSGFYTSPDRACLLGHRRLSVIDVAGGHQPLSNENGDVWTVFNGEIYNFADLRRELEAAGHSFRTRSDTEVLVHGWEQWGTGLPDRLRGMFAFAIWDERDRTLFLARDPLGKKPLYYSTHADVFRLGSELKCLMADPAMPRDVDPEALQFYLTLGYVPDPWSILRGVQKLPAGHWLQLKTGQVRVERYWRVPARPAYHGTFDDAVAELRERVTTAVQRRLISDVPLGAFLSGGIDSTIVVGVMSRLMNQPVQTFTIGFEEARFDESRFARLVAKRFGTAHHQMIVRPDALEVLPMLARHFDEPFADSSAIPTYYVSRFARQNVTVAMTGDGGDETFGGYRRYRAGKISRWLARIPGAVGLAQFAGALLPAGPDRFSDRARARRTLDALSLNAPEAYLAQMTQFDDASSASLLTPEFAAKIDHDLPQRWFASLYEGTDPADPSAASMTADFGSYLPGDILTKVDRASMAVSLECRCPLLDRDVVEFAASLPTEWRLRGLSGHKHILKHAFAELLPREIVARRKAGFAVPLAQWFRGPLKPLLHETLLSEKASKRGILQRAAVQRLIDAHVSGKANHAPGLWALLMLEMWFRTWT